MTKARNLADIGSYDKLATTSTGIDVTGTATMDGLTVYTGSASGTVASFKGSSGFGFTLSSDATSPYVQTIGVGGGEEVAITSGGTKLALFQDGGDISFYEDTGTTAKFFWDASAESLGIGTSSPISYRKLTLENNGSSGGLALNNSAGTLGAQFTLENVSTSTDLGIYSTGITKMYTAGTERMRIDSSGNLLVGTTTTTPYADSSGTGMAYRDDYGIFSVKSAGIQASIFNRTGSDGAITEFRKDGAPVGSIGVEGNDLWIGNTNAGVQFIDNTAGNRTLRPFNPSTNLKSDNEVDLGQSTARWQDLYLSGGVYLGGTGSANYLDDYEEGTWTPTYVPETGAFTTKTEVAVGRYTKVGRLVTVSGSIRTSGTLDVTGAGGWLFIAGLPYACNSVIFGGGSDTGHQVFALSTDIQNVNVRVPSGTSKIELMKNTMNGSSYPNGNITVADMNTSGGLYNNLISFTAQYEV